MAHQAEAGSKQSGSRQSIWEPIAIRRPGGPRVVESEEAIVQRVLLGDEKAFSALYERYLPRVAGYVRKRLDNRADMEEVVQDVFIAVFSSLGSFRGEAPFAAWVLGIARRAVANRFKRKQHPTVPLQHEEPDSTNRLDPMVRYQPQPDELYECQERIERIEERVRRRLTGEQQRIFQLHHVEHHSITEIAAKLHKSEDAVKSGLYRTRRVLMVG